MNEQRDITQLLGSNSNEGQLLIGGAAGTFRGFTFYSLDFEVIV